MKKKKNKIQKIEEIYLEDYIPKDSDIGGGIWAEGAIEGRETWTATGRLIKAEDWFAPIGYIGEVKTITKGEAETAVVFKDGYEVKFSNVDQDIRPGDRIKLDFRTLQAELIKSA